MVAKLMAMSLSRTRPQITINLDGYQSSNIATYSTHDRITGTVDVIAPVDLPATRLDINLTGAIHTFVERLSGVTAINGRVQALHQFLKLAQPISQTSWPTDKILLAGVKYSFQFLFVVPEQLLDRACRHKTASSTVHQEHLHLPPSVGDCAVSGYGSTCLDDFAPDMLRVKYDVSATLVPAHAADESGKGFSAAKKIRIIPASEERAPLADNPDSDYTLRVEKDMRKGVFQGKLGRLVVQASQPKSVRLQSYKPGSGPESTAAVINLRFDPIEGKSQLPKLGNLGTKVKVSTFFATTSRTRIPSKKDILWDLSQGVHTEMLNLASRSLSNVEWTFHERRTPSVARRNSCSSSSSDSSVEASSKYTGAGFYTAQIVVPISLPATKAWVPTFHSCLASRIYSISLHLGVSGGTGVDLRVPLQISNEANPEIVQRRLSYEQEAVEAMEADEFFTPRTIQASNAMPLDESELASDLPPGYDLFPMSSTRMTIRV